MPTDYPGAIDTLVNPSLGSMTPNPSHPQQHIDANDAIEAIETELGTTPSGAAATVAARFTAAETATSDHLADATDAHDASAISIADAGGDFTATTVEGALDELQADNEAHTALARHASSFGTSFPAQPAYGNDVPFFRTDRGIEYFYNGTRWLSMTLYNDSIGAVVALPISATSAANRIALPDAGITSLWVEKFWVTFFVTGGTALGAAHKWVETLRLLPSATTIATANIDSGASDVWRNSGAVAVAAVVATTEFGVDVVSTKTGTPGTLIVLPRMSYRLIG